MQGAARDGRRRARGPGRGRLDRRDRRAAGRGAVIKGIAAARAASCARTAPSDFSEAIRTTDKFAKDVEVDVELPSGTVRLTAQAKGAGMISPAFATMLCFVQTDAALAPETADLLLGVCVKRSFDRVSVDGQLSTNDTVILMGSGASRRRDRARVRGRAALRRGAGLGAAPARAGDRARRRGLQADRPRRRARRRRATRRRASRGRSRTRRWSRPRCTAATRTGAGSRRRSAARCGQRAAAVDIWIEDVQVCAGGAACRFDAGSSGRRGGRVHGRAARRRAPRPRSSSPTSRTST